LQWRGDKKSCKEKIPYPFGKGQARDQALDDMDCEWVSTLCLPGGVTCHGDVTAAIWEL
jgi:hypothetical protein